jgi:hypothetical protein
VRNRELHVGRLAGRRTLPVEEIRVPIDEPETAAARQCLEDAEQERAVAAENERRLASLQHLAHTGGDRQRPPPHVHCADYTGIEVAARVADARVGLSGVAPAEAVDQSGHAQRGGSAFLAASRPGAVDRGVDDGQASHSFPFLRDLFHRTSERRDPGAGSSRRSGTRRAGEQRGTAAFASPRAERGAIA